MVKPDPPQLRQSASSGFLTAGAAIYRWLRAGGAWVLVAAGVVTLLLWFWPLNVGVGASTADADGSGETQAAAGEVDRDWVHLSLRGPFHRAEKTAEPTFYEDEPISEVVLVGLSYRREGRSVGFFRIDGERTEILAVDEESQGMKVLSLAKDHAVVERDGERMELRRILDSEDGGGMF